MSFRRWFFGILGMVCVLWFPFLEVHAQTGQIWVGVREIDSDLASCNQFDYLSDYLLGSIIVLRSGDITLEGQQSIETYTVFKEVQAGSPPGRNYQVQAQPPGNYTLRKVCWSKDYGSSWHDGSSVYLRDGDTLKWNLMFSSDGVSGTPWFQAKGGSVLSHGELRSYIGLSSMPRYLILDGDGAANYPGLLLNTDFDLDHSLFSNGASYISSRNWHSAPPPERILDWHEFYRNYYDLTAVSPQPETSLSKPASRAAPYVFTPSMTGDTIETSGSWEIGTNENIVIFIDGNLQITQPITFQDPNSGFLAFIVRGSITIDPSVGGPSSNTDSPQLEGLYIANGSIRTGIGNKKLVARGIFLAGQDIVLERDIGNPAGMYSNANTPSELFLYNPALLFRMPQKLMFMEYIWKEVIP